MCGQCRRFPRRGFQARAGDAVLTRLCRRISKILKALPSRRGNNARMGRPDRREKDADAPFTLDALDTPGVRQQRLEHIVFEELYRLFRLEVSDPRLADVVPTSVQLSSDLRNAKVYYALRRKMPEAKLAAAAVVRTVQQGLEKVTPFLRARLAEVVLMKRLPDLHFHRDRLAESAQRAAEILR
jgi:ribosome-binding factor A